MRLSASWMASALMVIGVSAWYPDRYPPPQTSDQGTYPLPANDIWWWSMKTCSNFFVLGPTPAPRGDIWRWPLKLKRVRFPSGHTIHKILLEYWLVYNCAKVTIGFFHNSRLNLPSQNDEVPFIGPITSKNIGAKKQKQPLRLLSE